MSTIKLSLRDASRPILNFLDKQGPMLQLTDELL
jgi:hypothetical protein